MTNHQDTSTERDTLIDAARQALGFLRRQEISYGDRVAGQYADKLSDAVHAALASRDEAAQQPQGQSRSERLRNAGFTARDNRLTCDECGKKYTAQMLPVHQCEHQGQAEVDVAIADEFSPGHWTVSAQRAIQEHPQIILKMLARLKRLQQEQVVSDEQIDALIQQYLDPVPTYTGVKAFARAILALRDKPATAPDGTPNNAI